MTNYPANRAPESSIPRWSWTRGTWNTSTARPILPAVEGIALGFVVYVLTQNGIRDVPRDSSQQYVWLRKAGNFKAVNSRQEDTFELDELVPGDLLFWTGTYAIERDPPITHAMIYLGREKGTNHRIMVGASDGRTYKGESRYGVSVFDFKIPRPGKTDEGRTSPNFIGRDVLAVVSGEGVAVVRSPALPGMGRPFPPEGGTRMRRCLTGSLGLAASTIVRRGERGGAEFRGARSRVKGQIR